MSPIILILQLILFLLAFPIYVLNFLGIWDSIKKDLFSNLSDFANSSKELNVLEIGCGTGANFKFYPNGSRITCLDVNPNFQSYLSKSQMESDHIKFEGFVVASADNMTTVADASMDVVVCTLLACSLPDTPKMLEEVRRVLKPGGAFYFLEHVASTDDSSFISYLQKILNPTWSLCLDGCNLRKTTWKDLEQAKFSDLKLRHIQAPNVLMPITPHIVGYAIK
uniref:Methyltransferase type 11 domain-containing protein n=1 Tax=Leptobrachium leishanense TaxID=445787 RepID=A0A8C5M026_9ANUR